MSSRAPKPVLLVLASTYPRWMGDPEPGFVHELARRLRERFRVLVLCPHAPGARAYELLDGVEVFRYRYALQRWETLVNDGGIVANLKRHHWKFLLVPGFVVMQAWSAWRLCHRYKVDVIHAHWLIPQGLIAALLQLLPGRKAPFVVTSHGADLYALRSKPLVLLKRWVLRQSRTATVVSRPMLDEVARMGGDVAKVSVLSMGVDMSQRFVPNADISRSRNEILFVGRLVEKKGVRYLIDALALVRKRMPDAHLTVVGFGPEEDSLSAQVRLLGLESAVRFVGAIPQTQLPEYYRRAALFVAPFVQAVSGDQEGLGLVLVEAIACGCPILAGCVPAVTDVLAPSFADLMVVPSDTQALAERILVALSDPDASRSRAGVLRDNIMERFDWARVGERYADLLADTAGVS